MSTLFLNFFLHFKIFCHVQQTAAFNMFFVISVFCFCSSSCNLHNKGDILFILLTTKIEGNFVIRMHLTVRCLEFVARVLCQRCSFSFKVKIGRITVKMAVYIPRGYVTCFTMNKTNILQTNCANSYFCPIKFGAVIRQKRII